MGSTWGLVLRNVSRALAARRSRGEESEEGTESGFTLIELMVVLLIMGILLAIAIPTFLGLTGGANDRSAQSNLTNALTNAKAVYAQSQTFTFTTTGTGKQSTVAVKKLDSSTTSLTFTTSASPTHSNISVDVAGPTTLVMAAWMEKTDVCWVARAQEAAPTTKPYSLIKYASVATYKATKKATCSAAKVATTATVKALVTWTTAFPPSPTGH